MRYGVLYVPMQQEWSVFFFSSYSGARLTHFWQGLDIRDIELVIQWRYTHSLCTLIQRLGRAARELGIEATGIYIVEPRYFNHNKKVTDGVVGSKRKRGSTKEKVGPQKKAKRVAVAASRQSVQQYAEALSSDSEEESDSDTEVPQSLGAASRPLHREGDDTISSPPISSQGSSSTLTTRYENPSSSTRSLHVSEIQTAKTHLPSPSTVTEDEYNSIAMDLFINSRAHRMCRRVIPDEYCMNNTIGKYRIWISLIVNV